MVVTTPPSQPTLAVGDPVDFQGQHTTVRALEAVRDPGDKYGVDVPSVPWGSLFVADLANGHWSYGHQLRPLGGPDA